MTYNRGISLIEIIISVAILGILVATVLASFSGIRTTQVLESDRNLIVSTLTTAKLNTLASKGLKSYGVHIDTANNQLVIFEGTTYDSAASTNQAVPLDSRVRISAYTGGMDIVFDRLTGAVWPLRSIVVNATGGPSKTINVFPSGVILSE